MLTKHEFISWLFENNCFIKTTDKKSTVTHVAYDGGKLCVPDDLMDEFWKKYQKCIEDKPEHPLCLCENITQVCKMFCDLDVLEDIDSTEPFNLNEVLKIMDEVVQHHFMKSYPIFVCKTPLKEVSKNGKKYKKTGIHLYWKELYLEPKTCLDLSKQFVKAVIERLGNRTENENSWDDVIDDQVYKMSLRMIHSKKLDKKRVPRNEVYEISQIYPSGNTEEIEWRECTIQTYKGEKATVPINPIPEFLTEKEMAVSNISDEVELHVEQFIQKAIPEWNYPLDKLLKKGQGYVAKMKGAMYCLNAEREHNSCGIYFHFTQDGMTQRCFCKCDQMRPSGIYCKDFKSKNFPIGITLTKLLFPNKKKKRKVKNYDPSKPEMYGSNLYLKKQETLSEFIKMSYNTVLDIEKKC